MSNVDIYLDPDTHDIVVSDDGTIRLTESTEEDAAQRLKIRLLIFEGEWVLDNREGVPYYQSILTKASKEVVDAIFKSKIMEESLVSSIDEFESVYDTSARTYSLSFSVTLTTGETVDSEVSLDI